MPEEKERYGISRTAEAVIAAMEADPERYRFPSLDIALPREFTEGWRSQLLAGHEKTLRIVADSMSSAITDTNLLGLAAARVAMPTVGLENLTRVVREAAAAYTTGFGAALRDSVIKSIEPAARAATGAMMERLKASTELQRDYEDDLRRLGWWFPPSVSMSFFWEIGRLAHDGQRVSLRRTMADASKSREFGRVVDSWMDLDVFAKRRRFIRDGLQDHRRGRYRVSIPTLLPQIEGIAVAAFDPASKMGTNLVRTASATYDAVMGPAMVEAVGVLWESRSFSEFSPRALNRHFILHGRSTAYATEENSTKVLFALDLLASIVRDAKEHPERAAAAS